MRLEVVERMAREGVPEMQFLLGFLKENGFGLNKDIPEAHEWYRRAGEQGFAPAQYMLYYANGPEKYQSRTINETDNQIAEGWLRKAASGGFSAAQFDLSYRIADPTQSRQLLESAAEKGYALAAQRLGRLYQEGYFGQAPDSGIALKWLKRAAELGNAEAAYAVAEAYRYGIQAWAEASIKTANLESPHLNAEERNTAGEIVARILTDGEYTTTSKDKAEALQWYLKAFEMKSPDAASALSSIYTWGKLGQPKDRTKADFYATKNREFRKWWAESLGFPDQKHITG